MTIYLINQSVLLLHTSNSKCLSKNLFLSCFKSLANESQRVYLTKCFNYKILNNILFDWIVFVIEIRFICVSAFLFHSSSCFFIFFCEQNKEEKTTSEFDFNINQIKHLFHWLRYSAHNICLFFINLRLFADIHRRLDDNVVATGGYNSMRVTYARIFWRVCARSVCCFSHFQEIS